MCTFFLEMQMGLILPEMGTFCHMGLPNHSLADC